MGEVEGSFAIGDTVWRAFGKIVWRAPFDDWDPAAIEPWSVARITPAKVFVRSYLDPANPSYLTYELKRAGLQRLGYAFTHRLRHEDGSRGSAVFLARAPEAYRRKTVGYLIQSDARALLGVDHNASADEIRRAFRAAAKRLHPDRPDGDTAAFMAVKAAYDKLQSPLSLGEILDFIRQQASECAPT